MARRQMEQKPAMELEQAFSSVVSSPSPAHRPILTVLLGQLYFSKTSCTRSSPPSVNIMIILLQLARVMLDCGADTAPEATHTWSQQHWAQGCMQLGGLAPTHFFSQPISLGRG